MAADTSFPASIRPTRPALSSREGEERSVRSAVAVVLAGVVLVVLLVGGGAMLATVVDLVSWVGAS